jgi:hypothetical protein
MRLRLLLLAFLLMPLGISGCAALQQIAALRHVQFAIDGVQNVRLAGVNLDNAQGPEHVGAAAITSIGAALATGRMPLQFVMLIGADNPAENPVEARMLQFDWTLLLDDVETVSGTFNDERLIPPGQRTTFPLGIELDLLRFFDRNLQSLLGLAFAVSGQGGEADVALRARPTISTPFGPITYPGDIILRHTVRG